MAPTGEVDLHSDSGYRRFNRGVDDEANGHGIRGANLLLRTMPASIDRWALAEGGHRGGRRERRASPRGGARRGDTSPPGRSRACPEAARAPERGGEEGRRGGTGRGIHTAGQCDERTPCLPATAKTPSHPVASRSDSPPRLGGSDKPTRRSVRLARKETPEGEAKHSFGGACQEETGPRERHPCSRRPPRQTEVAHRPAVASREG